MNLEHLTQSVYIATEETYRDGEIIFNEGSSGDWIYIVLSGEIEIFKMVRGKKIIVDILKKGDMFGEVSFVDKQPRSAGARAVGSVKVGVYDRSFLTQEYNKLPSDFRAIFDALARRLRKMTSVATNLAGRRTERVAQTLVVQYKTDKEFFSAYSSNIGGGGLFVRTDNLLDIGLEVNVQFNLPGDSRPLITAGKIAWTQKEPEQGMGIQFINMKPEDEARLRAFVKEKSPD